MDVIPIILLITLHGPNGQEIDINPHEVSSIREPAAVAEGHFPKGTKCIVIMNNSRVNAVLEDCNTVRIMVEKEKQP